MIYALRVADNYWRIDDALKEGEGRFGWSYIPTANLYDFREKIENEGWNELSEDEQNCYGGQTFLLELKKNDYVVYINVPEYGKCTLARVTGPYFWCYKDRDFNHRFHVAPESVFIFDRNDAIVHPLLSRRLKLQGRFWRIYLQEEFEELVENLKKGKGGQLQTSKTRLGWLKKEIQPSLAEITRKIYRTYPGADLEGLIARVFENVPGIIEVTETGGAGDHGADLILRFESGPPVLELQEQRTCVVQVKSYEGEHSDPKAVKDIRRALDYWQADMGLIVSTASSGSEELDKALDKLREETGKTVSLLIGEDVAAFVLRFGGHDLL